MTITNLWLMREAQYLRQSRAKVRPLFGDVFKVLSGFLEHHPLRLNHVGSRPRSGTIAHRGPRRRIAGFEKGIGVDRAGMARHGAAPFDGRPHGSRDET